MPLEKFIFALGIRHVGERTAQQLARYAKDLDGFLNLSETELIEIPDIGVETSAAICDFLASPQERDQIARLRNKGFNPKLLEEIPEGGLFEGLTFVLTGTLEQMTRDQAAKKIESLAGKVSGSVSKKTSFVVAGRDAGSKLKKAEDLGVPVLSETEFLEKVGNYES